MQLDYWSYKLCRGMTYSYSSPVFTTTSIILCFNKHRLTQIHLENGCDVKLPAMGKQSMYCSLCYSRENIELAVLTFVTVSKVKCAILHWSLGGVLISLPKAVSP